MKRGIATWLLGVALAAAWAAPASALSNTPKPTFVTDGTVEAVAQAGATTYIGGQFTSVGPRTGPAAAVDTTTAQADLSMPQVSGGDGIVYAVASDGSGGWYLAGSFTHVGGLPRGNVAHILANKTVDPNFAPNVNGRVQAIALSGSTLYIGGLFTTVGGQPRSMLAALDARGQPTSWNPSVSSGGEVSALALSGSNVIVGGTFNAIDGVPEDGIAAVDAATGVPTWVTSANTDSGVQVQTVAVSGSTVYVGGHFLAIGGQSRTCVAALDAATGAPNSWAPTLDTGSLCSIESLAVSGATVYANGHFAAVDGQPRPGLVALDGTSGSPTAWDPQIPICCSAGPIAISGSTVFVGLGEFDANTGALRSWNPKANGGAIAIALSGSTMYAGGDFSSMNVQPRSRLAALGSDGSVTAWNPNPTQTGGISAEIRALAVSGSTVYAGGTFNSIGGQPRTAIAALDASSGQATSWNPNLGCSRLNCNPFVSVIAPSGSNVYVAGLFDSIGGQPRNSAAALDSSTAVATPWNPTLSQNGFISAIAPSDSTIYVGGSFSSIDGQPRSNLAAVDATTGQQATSWNPNVTCATKCAPTNGNVGTLVQSGPTLYIGGYFDAVGGQPRSNLAAVSVPTAAPTSWNPGTDGLVRSLTVSGSTVYAGGDFKTVGGQPRSDVAALATGTGAVGAFDPEPNSTVYSVVATPTGTLDIGGSFNTLELGANQGFAQFGP